MQYLLEGHGACAVLDSTGGELIGYQKDGVEYVWQGDPAYWAGHAPVLFPIVGALKDGSIRIGGAICNIPKHGAARKREFVMDQKADDSAVFSLRADAQSFAMYPFRFLLSVTHQLLQHGFQTTYTVKNEDDRDMPFCIGGHPAFRCPLNSGEGFEDYALIFEKKETVPAIYTDGGTLINRNSAVQLMKDENQIPLRYSDFDQDAFILDGLVSREVKLLHKTNGKGLKLSFDGFSALGVWTPPKKNAPFLCLEPWAGLPAFPDETGEFLDKPYAMVLKPGEAKHFHYAMEAL